MIGARRMAFPRIESLTFWLLMAAGVILDDDHLLRRLPDRLDGLPAARRPGEPGHRLLHPLLRARRHLDDAPRPEHDRDDRDDARAGADLDAAADLRLGRPLDRGPDGARRAGADRDALDGAARPRRADDLLRPSARGQPVPLREPLLGLRPPGGVHPRPARLRDRARDPAGVRAQAAVGLPARGRRAARRDAAVAASSGSTTCS